MKNVIYIILASCFFCCTNTEPQNTEISKKDSLLLNSISQNDMANNPCRKFKKLKTADEYFQSANDRSKDCPSDSLTNMVALKEYELAVKLDPKFGQAKRNYARQLFYFKEYAKCIEQLNRAIELAPPEDCFLYALRGQALYKLGKYQKAIDDYDVAIKYLGNSSFEHLLKAKAEWKLGQKDKACIDFNIAIKAYPDYIKEKEFIECN